MPDRIEAGSYACAAGITGGSIELVGARPGDMLAITNALAAAGLAIEFTASGMKVTAHQPLKPLAISTAPYPGFPTDMQAQFMAMLSVAEGQSFLEETIFENRYMHVPELRVYHLDRGYERLEEKLSAVGATIERVSAG
jgi:UDP-N-acetylglucosamine 1-carboxyvinyltransferase